MSVADSQWPAVGATGARFGSAARNRRTYIPKHAAAASAEIGADGARMGNDPVADGARGMAPAESVGMTMPVVSDDRTSDRAMGGAGVGGNDVGDVGMDQEAPSFVRPFVRSQGRTRAEVDLPLEALVSTSALMGAFGSSGSIAGLDEHRVVLGLCAQPRSIMEVAALAGVPLGVARVLVGDLAASGELTVHRTVDRIGPGAELLKRVLTGLNEL